MRHSKLKHLALNRAAFSAGASAAVTNQYRLPRTVLPESYQLRLKPDLDAGTYEGSVSIQVTISEATSSIALNAITFDDKEERQEPNLVLGEATVSDSQGTVFTCQVEAEPLTDRIHLKVNGSIGTGKWTIDIAFRGKLNDHMQGFYRSTYEDAEGVEQVIATTQFEATDARRAFPCFDEPDMKATFQVSLEVAEELTAISNTRVVSEKLVPHSRKVFEEGPYFKENAEGRRVLHYHWEDFPGTGRKVVEFAPTMKMSTYILAFVVGKLVRTKPVMVDGVEVSAYCVPGKENLTSFALKMTEFALRYYRKFFGRAYPSDKLDIAAIPDFAAGAMENMGLATFREVYMLVDEATSSQSALHDVADTVGHEIAHMWFGNLVTMKWWNGLWLKEAFAVFMANKCIDAWMKDWNVWDKFALSRAAAFETDGLVETRSVEYTVLSPEDATGMYDALTYEKSSSLLRMLEMFMGEQAFQKGMALYVRAHAYGNTEGADLWAALGKASGMDVGTIMHNWIWTPGYPVVSVSQPEGAGCVTLKQSQFKYLADGVNEGALWHVPVLLRAKTADGVIEVKHMLTQAQESVYLGEGVEWVVVNAGGHGFYRVAYSNELAEKLTASAQETLSVIERANLLADEWACVRAGIKSALTFLSLAKLFGNESDPNVWSFITEPLDALRGLLPADKRTGFEAMVRELVGPALTRLGFEAVAGESHQLCQLRADLLSTQALTGNDRQLVSKAHALFANWKSDKSSVNGDIIASLVHIVAATGDESHYNEFYALYKAADHPEDEDRFRTTLVEFQNWDLVEKTLQLCLGSKDIRQQDAPWLIGHAIGNETAGERAWDFAKKHWEKLDELYEDSGMTDILSAVCHLDTAALEADVQAFYADHPITGFGKMPAQYLEMQRINRLLRERETAVLTAEFAKTPA